MRETKAKKELNETEKSKLIVREKYLISKSIRESGITLIALIVTIIVLLILAGVSIATLTGDNGILTQANNAKDRTEEAEVEELRKLTQGEAATHLEDYEYTDANGEKLKIPAKCAVSQVEGENTLADGLVIIDSNGNEWVWIEVPRVEDIYKQTGISEQIFTQETYENIEKDLLEYVADYRVDSNGNQTEYTDSYYNGVGISNEQAYNVLKEKMLKSVYLNEGFWVGRYETGIEKSFRYYGSEYAVEHPIEDKPVIKQNVYPYNWVRCSQAQQLAKSLSPNEYDCNLMFGIQYDLMLKSLENNYTELGNKTEKIGNIKTSIYSINNPRALYSLDWGKSWNIAPYNKKEESYILLTTGSSENFKLNNIYDIIGNVNEWTLEYTKKSPPCVYRGGALNASTITIFNNRTQYSNVGNSDSIGFRVCMY